METIITKTYTKEELNKNYSGGDTLKINNELINEFTQNNPDVNIIKASGVAKYNNESLGESVFGFSYIDFESITYTLTIQYETN